jgi:hypothetical protein
VRYFANSPIALASSGSTLYPAENKQLMY